MNVTDGLRNSSSSRVGLRSSGSNVPTNSGIDESHYRLMQLFNRLLLIEISLGTNKPSVTVRQIIDDPRIRKLFIHKVNKKLFRNVRHFNKNLRDKYEAAISDPRVVAAEKMRQRHLSAKIVKNILKILNAFAKHSVFFLSAEIKNLHTIVKFFSKAAGSPDAFNFKGIDSITIFVGKSFKASYSTLTIVTNSVKVLNDHDWTQMAYASFGWGSDFRPLPLLLSTWCDQISPCVSAMRLCIKANNFKDAIINYQTTTDTDTLKVIKYKKWKVVKSVAEVTGEVAKIGLKVIIYYEIATIFPVAAPAIIFADKFVPFATLFLTVTSAAIGWSQTYTKRQIGENPGDNNERMILQFSPPIVEYTTTIVNPPIKNLIASA